MAVKCILTGQTPSVLDGVTENVQTQLDNKVDKDGNKVLSTNDYTTAEKTKLSGIEAGAQKNTVTSVNGNTGAVTISIPTVNNATIAIQKNGTQVGSFTTNQSSAGTINMTLAKSDVGLGNVDNTSDASKPISTATQTALNAKSGKATSFTVTLTAAGWSSNAQTVSNSNFVTSGYTYIVSPASGSFSNYSTAIIYADDVTTAGKMTFHCTDTPTSNLTVNIARLEASV